MAMHKLNRLTPAYKDYLWGGDELKKHYHKDSPAEIIAESWELSTHPDGLSRMEGQDLREYVKQHPEVLGTACKDQDIPILIKFIDARQRLSIQVHPQDEFARRVEHDNGKTEMWYIVDAAPGAYLYLGVSQAMSQEQFRAKIADHTVLEVLNKVLVKRGEVYLIKAGTIHAIGEGCLIIEIQERSNVTYRVYDFDRRDKNGNLRPLHIDRALEVANLQPTAISGKPEKLLQSDAGGTVELLKETKYFHVYDYRVQQHLSLNVDGESFWALMMVHGEGTVSCGSEQVSLRQGESLFIPAGSGTVTIAGSCEAVGARL